MIQATKHFSIPNNFTFVVVSLVPPLFRLRDSTHLCFMPVVDSVLPRSVGNAKHSFIKFSFEMLKPFKEDLSALEGPKKHQVA